MASFVDHGLGILAVLACWYGLGTGRRVRGVIAVGIGSLANAGLLLSLDAGFLAALAAPVAALGLLTVLVFLLAQGAPRANRRPSRRRRLTAALAGFGAFAALGGAVTASEFPVPLEWAANDSAVMAGRELLTRSAFVLKALGLALLAAVVAGVWLSAPHRQLARQAEAVGSEDTEAHHAERYRLEHHRRGGS